MIEPSTPGSEDTVGSTRADSSARSGDGDRETPLERGLVVGRYVVLARVGAGGMGVVYAAYDPELDRKVAIKLLHGGRSDADTKALLLREAQALAKLAHANVVTVHDVGMLDDRVWLAMEFIAGTSLRAWSRARPGRWREALPVFVAAGRGLAAAHDAGMVHRDFKPDNVMVADDGRVLVMDFGLARAHSSTPEMSRPARRTTPPDPGGPDLHVTPLGGAVGTPAYMAPEQLAGTSEDARSDQFAFAVTVWESLCGQRPFAGDTFVELAANVLAGRMRPVPRESAMPRWLRHVLARALSVDPQRRFADMTALLEALGRGQVRARGRTTVLAVGALAVVIAGVAIGQGWEHRKRAATCAAEGEALTEVWNEEGRARVRDGILATGLAYAEPTADRVMPWLDAWASSWRETREHTCLQATASAADAGAAQLHARADECLDERRMDFEALLDDFADADGAVVQRAVRAAAGLPRVEPCARAEVLAQRPTLPEGGLDEIRTVRRLLARAGSSRISGKYGDGVALAEEALAAAEALGYPALVAEARFTLGAALDSAGDYERAEVELARAYVEGGANDAPVTVADAAAELVYVVGVHRARHAEACVWAKAAEVAAEAMGDVDELREVGRLRTLGTVLDGMGAFAEAGEQHERALELAEAAVGGEHPLIVATLNNFASHERALGRHAAAKALQERALAMAEAALGPEHPDVALILNNIGNLHASLGEYAEAKVLFESSLVIRERSLGPEHPDVAASLSNLGLVHESMGAYPEAAAALERAIAIREKTLGPEHPQLATSVANLAIVRTGQGRHAEARPLFERALAIREKALGPDHPEVASSVANLATCLNQLGLRSEAKALHERALAIREKALGPEHDDVAGSLGSLADIQLQLDELDQAKALYERALSIREHALGVDHPALAYPLIGLAEVALAQGRAVDALAPAKRALALREAQGVATLLAEARFLVARVLWELPPDHGQDRAHARELAEQARQTFRATAQSSSRPSGPEPDTHSASVDTWLASHP